MREGFKEYDMSAKLRMLKPSDSATHYSLEFALSNSEDYQRCNLPYGVNLFMIGHFTIHPDIPENEWDDLVANNGTMMLHSAARELVLSMTSRCSWGSFLLPTITVDELYQDDSFSGQRQQCSIS